VPVLFIPISNDLYVLPRAALALAGGGLLAAAGLLAGRRSLGRLRVPALAVALAAVAAAALSIAPAASLVGSYGRYESLPMRLAYLGLFCGAVWLGERRRVTAAFLAGCGVAAGQAVLQARLHVPFRPDGNLGQPNLLGALLAMAVPLALDRARNAEPRPRVAWLALAALLAAGLAVSTSRSGWVGALAGAAVLALFLVPRRRLPLVAAGGGLALAAAAALLVASPLRHLNQDTGEARVGVWGAAAAAVAARPVLGWGEDTTGLVLGRYQTVDWEPGHSFDRAHSMPLDLAATQGLLGLAACAWLFAAWWAGVWRARSLPLLPGLAGAAAAYLAWSLVNFDWAPATAALWLLAGAAWPGDPPASDHSRAGERWRLPAAAAAALAGLALAVPPLVADLEFFAQRPDRAAAIDPAQAHYQAAVGSLESLRRAAALGDPDPATYVALGDAERDAGHPAAALAAYRQALARYPFDTDARQRLRTAQAGPATVRPRAASG
jgi:hypothetical protein